MGAFDYSFLAMNFMRSKAEHLADHLREAIARGGVANPLPTIRRWSASLGVASGTLEAALRILKRDGIIRSRPRRGLYLLRRPGARSRHRYYQVVRWICPTVQIKHNPGINEVAGALLRKLSVHGIGLTVEMLDNARLKALCQRGERPEEMLLMHSLPREWQERFLHFKTSLLLIGRPFPDIPLPFVSNDMIPAIRHAVFLFACHDFEEVVLLLTESSRQPIREEFDQICAAAPRPIRGEIVQLPDEMYEQSRAVQRFSARIRPRQGLIAVSPIHAGQLMMAVMQRGLRMPGEVQVIAMNALPTELRSLPIPVHYPYPLERFSRILCGAAYHFFEQGSLPRLRKLIPLQMVSPPN